MKSIRVNLRVSFCLLRSLGHPPFEVKCLESPVVFDGPLLQFDLCVDHLLVGFVVEPIMAFLTFK